MSNHAWPEGILNVSRLVGLTPSVLRIWEGRYGWPKPQRFPNGYRRYSQDDVRQLVRVAHLVKSGVPISRLIVDGKPTL